MSPLQAYVHHAALGGDARQFARIRHIPLNVALRLEAAAVKMGWLELAPRVTPLGYRKAIEP